MKTWLLTFLRDEAIDWYGRHQPDKVSRSIKDRLKSLRAIVTCPGAHCMISYRGDVSAIYQEDVGVQHPLPGGGSWSYGVTSWTGLNAGWEAVFIKLGVPVIDCRPAEYNTLRCVVINGPMIAVGDTKVSEFPWGPFDYAPLTEVARLHRSAGCIVHNIEKCE